MNGQWKPGDAAMVLGRWRWNKPHTWKRAYWVGDVDMWGSLDDDTDCAPFEVSEIRPLVVIDPEDTESLDRLCKSLVEAMYAAGDKASAANGVHPATMQAALREYARPTPPRPEEPTGLGAVVEDASGKTYIRTGDYGADDWRRSGIAGGSRGRWMRYDEIDAVRVLSEGVTQ